MALKQQVRIHVLKARELFDHRKLGPLEELLKSLAPAAAIMLNIEISLVSQSYSEESATLSRTLLPFITQVSDYRFLNPEANFIANRFLASLVVHLKDTETPVDPGFVHFALHLNPRSLKNVITIGDGVMAL